MGLKFTIGFILWEMTQWYSIYMRLFWTPKSCFFLSSVPWGVNTVPASISVMYLKTSWVLCKTREYNVKDCLGQVVTVFLRIGEETIVFVLGSKQAQHFHKFDITHTFKQSGLNTACKNFAPFHCKKHSGLEKQGEMLQWKWNVMRFGSLSSFVNNSC